MPLLLTSPKILAFSLLSWELGPWDFFQNLGTLSWDFCQNCFNVHLSSLYKFIQLCQNSQKDAKKWVMNQKSMKLCQNLQEVAKKWVMSEKKVISYFDSKLSKNDWSITFFIASCEKNWPVQDTGIF